MSYSFTCKYCQKTYTYKNANSLASGKSNHNTRANHLKNVEEYNKNNSETKHITILRNEFKKKYNILEDYLFKKGKRINQLEEELQQTKEELQQIKEHLNMKI